MAPFFVAKFVRTFYHSRILEKEFFICIYYVLLEVPLSAAVTEYRPDSDRKVIRASGHHYPESAEGKFPEANH